MANNQAVLLETAYAIAVSAHGAITVQLLMDNGSHNCHTLPHHYSQN